MRLNAIGAVLAANVALAGALGYLWTDEAWSRWQEPEALPPLLEEIGTAPLAEPVDVSRYRETVQRPLFASTRRPAPRTDKEEASAAADALKDVRLLGIYGVGQRGGIIVLSGGQVLRLAVGESLRGWKVVALGAGRGAELARADGTRRQLELALNNAAAAPAAASEGRQGAEPPTASEQAPASASVPSRRSQGAAASRGDAANAAEIEKRREEQRRRRIENINQRRAARGLPLLEPAK